MALTAILRITGSGLRDAGTTLSRAPVRLKILLAILVLVCVGALASKIHIWRLERQLLRIAEDIVINFNKESPIVPDAEAGGTNTTCEAFCSRKYVIFGPATGKIVFFITPRCDISHSTEEDRRACAVCSGRATYELDYFYIRDERSWVFHESAMCCSPRAHR